MTYSDRQIQAQQFGMKKENLNGALRFRGVITQNVMTDLCYYGNVFKALSNLEL